MRVSFHTLRLALLACLVATALLAQSGPPPGVVVATTPDLDGAYIGTPGIAILPDGSYVAAHDFFGKNKELYDRTRVYGSRDRGATWSLLSGFPGRRGSRSSCIAARCTCTAPPAATATSRSAAPPMAAARGRSRATRRAAS
ncbi:MAG TPA: hypothetical protein VGE76_17635 [Opitutaceae bacterium]